jgi:hypothetical protein
MADCVFFGGVGRGAKLRPPVESHHSSTFDCCLFVVRGFRCNSLAPSARIASLQQKRGGGLHCDTSPPLGDHLPHRLPRPPAWLLLHLPPRYSCRAEPRRSATWPMINAARCGTKSSPSGGAIVFVRGNACRRRPGPGGPPCGGVARGAAPGSGVGGGGGGAGFAARLPPPPSCRAENASVIAGLTPGVMDQDLRRSEAWLGNRRRLAGVIRAVVAGLPPQAQCRGRSRGGASC